MMTCQKVLICAVLSCMISLPISLSAQKMEMHAANPKAITLMEDALMNMGHDMGVFGNNVEEAAKLDPTMVMANFFAGMDPDLSPDEARPFMERIQAYEGELSEGEQIITEMSSHFGEENYNFFAELNQLADAYPSDARMQIVVGVAFMYAEKAAEAIPYLERAEELGGMPGTHNMLGYAYMSQGNMEQAKQHFEAYAKAAPDHYNPNDSMGDYYMAIKDYASAAEMYDKAAKLNPTFPGHAQKAEKAREMMEK